MPGGLLERARKGVGAGGVGTVSAVDPLVSLHDDLNTNDDRLVLSLKTSTNDLSDLYLRIVSLDDFDGTTWKASAHDYFDVPDPLPTPAGLDESVRRDTIRTTITAADTYAQDSLPMPYPPSRVKASGRWRYEPVGMTLAGDHGQTTRGERYEVTSLDVKPTAEQLAAAPPPPAALWERYTKVPSSLPKVVARTAKEVTAGASSHYEEAVKLQDYFAVTGGFQYDTQVEAGQGPRAIANFLEKKQGFCVHFSFAMAAMARTLGIPARVAVGFAPGSPQSDGTVAVNQRDAHAWPELYFEGVGWTRFEPTPTRGTTPSYTQTDTPGSSLPDEARPSRHASSAPSAAASPSESCAEGTRRPRSCGHTHQSVSSWPLIGVGALLVLAVPLSPLLWRRRTRALRLGGHGRTPQGAAAHTLAAWQELTDSAWDHGIPPDESLTPRKAADRIVRLGRLDPAAGAAVHRVADAVEQVLYAPRPRPAAGTARDVREAVEGLRTVVGA
uniref:transglutaminase TgpA family protein n=1 Tax=Streptomyces sp. WELS2 TaxID=2749435 RepID=UPI0015F100C3